MNNRRSSAAPFSMTLTQFASTVRMVTITSSNLYLRHTFIPSGQSDDDQSKSKYLAKVVNKLF